MANLKQNNLALHIDNASATLTDVSLYVNSQQLARTIAMLEDTGVGLEESTFLPGLAGTKLTLNGFVNTTTDGIFGPAYVSDNTSLTKTIAFRQSSSRFYKGEVWMDGFTYSGDRATLQTFAGTLTFTGAITRTSIVGS